MDRRSKFGHWGEEKAAEYLAKIGYKLVAKNYRCPHGEIDLIMTRREQLIFVEVKARKSLAFGRPAEAVTKQKQEKIKITALHFLQKHTISYHKLSFDVMELYYVENKLVINHIPHCF